MKAKERKFEDLMVGQEASFERTVTEQDVTQFAQISGDYNPLHLDDEYAKTTEYQGTIVYGMFMAALVSRLVGMELPGKKALLMKESLEFKKPVRVGDVLVVKGVLAHKSQASGLVEIAIEIRRADELLVAGSVHARVLK